MSKVDFHYIKTGTGELSGPSFVEQTELAINELGEIFVEAETDASEALKIAKEAQTTANNASLTADTALTQAQTATGLATNAQNTANGAQTTADSALAKAEAAQAAADEKAPIMHAVEATTYGLGSDTLYGHVQLSDSVTGAQDVSAGMAATPYAVSQVKTLADTAQTSADTAQTAAEAAQSAAEAAQSAAEAAQSSADEKAPIMHASTEPDYGLGSAELYGHVKLSDALDGEETAEAGGTAATPYAVAQVKGLADAAQTAADAAQGTADTNTALIQALQNTVDSLESDWTFTVTDSRINGNTYAEGLQSRLYVTADAEATSSNLPDGVVFPLYLWAEKTSDGLGGKVHILDAANTLYTQTGTGTQTTEETTNEETGEVTTTTTTTWAYSGWRKVTYGPATVDTLGVVKPDGTTLTAADGVLSVLPVPNITGESQENTDGTLDISKAACFMVTISTNTTFSFTGVSGSSTVACFSLILTNGGAATVTWPSSVKWADGTAPELTAAGVDVLTFLTADGGDTWYGSVSVKGAA